MATSVLPVVLCLYVIYHVCTGSGNLLIVLTNKTLANSSYVPWLASYR